MRRLPWGFLALPLLLRSLDVLAPLLLAYDRSYTFSQNIIYYSIKAHPVDHFKAFYRFTQAFTALNLLAYNCFPLRCSRSPCFATIDSKVSCQKILDRIWINGADKIVLWRGVVNLNNSPFRDQNHDLRFRETIQRGGVGVTLLKKRFDTQGRYSSGYISPQQDKSSERGLIHSRALELEYYVAFLSSRSEHTAVLQTHYVSTRANYATVHPIHQKLQLSPYFKNQFADHATFVIGNWSDPNSRLHEPIHDVLF
ncbi:hypothetical protein G6F57_004271 [Rhizopus arrhizus]|uniref:Uncharacterized protein n=1 Tax=Rhizopus oryzae TaxID=64495 RepID=A0A9P7BU19_RHIOR|nr:hypothetical protein G6F23_009265 [Rhizopus arrhizus]KAG1405211.1 hypothetical protein G6F58_010052 [Rhizopus delemar]KAG0765959.1 hypothetical protein G6F24_004000 [Rhizopus arrhizus]KAG0785911.1 hypothetical protein G6F22_007793 [Rhizopus arrhizus]KAG0792782.1 hypothetical protein G6F21_004098 [Rhizopus arrhizus]